MNAAAAISLQLAAWSGAAAERHNRIAARRAPLQIPGYEQFSLHRIEPFEAEADFGVDRCAIELDFGADKLAATMSHRLLFDLFAALDADLSFDPLPLHDLAALMLEAVLLPLLEPLERCTSRDIKITAIRFGSNADAGSGPDHRPAAAVSPPSVDVYLSLRGPGLRQTLTIRGSADALDPLLSPWSLGARPLAALPIGVSFQAGATLLSVPLIKSLRTGDAILLQDVFVRHSSSGRSADAFRMVIAETLTTTVRRTRDGWRLDAAPRRQWQAGQTMADEIEDDPNENQAAAALDSLPVRLVFEAARLELALGELRGLGSGSVLQIDAAPGTVRIVANGRSIATGELITIDGRAGVRIMAFDADADGSPQRSLRE